VFFFITKSSVATAPYASLCGYWLDNARVTRQTIAYHLRPHGLHGLPHEKPAKNKRSLVIACRPDQTVAEDTANDSSEAVDDAQSTESSVKITTLSDQLAREEIAHNPRVENTKHDSLSDTTKESTCKQSRYLGNHGQARRRTVAGREQDVGRFTTIFVRERTSEQGENTTRSEVSQGQLEDKVVGKLVVFLV
jgi:hypothetical protein